MFSKKSVIIIAVIVVFTVNVIMLSVAGTRYSSLAVRKIMISIMAPFQEITSRTIRYSQDLWRHYFYLVSVSRENDDLKKALNLAVGNNKDNIETALANARLRNLLSFQKSMNSEMVACEVIAKDPTSIYKTVLIDKGGTAGLKTGLPVVISEGVVGQIINVSPHYAKVLLVIDVNSSVDALVQRTRARGLLKGASLALCRLDYVSWKDDVILGDIIVSSGSDGVFPKGLLLGQVVGGEKHATGIFQEVSVRPFVDFEKLEEVLVILNPPVYESENEQ
jgi:rod shape-determining protein MreC